MNDNMTALRGAIGIHHDRFELSDHEYSALYAFDPNADFLKSCKQIGAKYPRALQLKKIVKDYETTEWNSTERSMIRKLVECGVELDEAQATIDDISILDSSERATAAYLKRKAAMTPAELQEKWETMTPRQQRAYPNFLKPADGRGGLRNGAGRPALGVIRKTVTITPSSIDTLRVLGDGDLSLGIRRAAEKLGS